MKTQDLPRSSRPPRAHFPLALFGATRPRSSLPGDWRYAARPHNRGPLLAGVLVAAGVHAAMFYGFSPSPAPVRPRALPKAEAIVQIAMPPLPPEETDDRPRELIEEPSATVMVPQLADVPAAVALSDFSQSIDLRPHAEVDLGALKTMTIPMARGRGGSGFGNGSMIFSLSQLDRVPQAIAQPTPDFPKGVHVIGLEEIIVVVEFIVDAEGRVIEPRVTSSNAPEFNRAALLGVARWKFRPGILGGRKVPTRMEVPLKFDLNAGL